MDTMSDTPRIQGCLSENIGQTDFYLAIQLFQLGQNLERELNSTRQAFSDYMTKATIEAEELKHEIGNLRQHIELLKASK